MQEQAAKLTQGPAACTQALVSALGFVFPLAPRSIPMDHCIQFEAGDSSLSEYYLEDCYVCKQQKDLAPHAIRWFLDSSNPFSLEGHIAYQHKN